MCNHDYFTMIIYLIDHNKRTEKYKSNKHIPDTLKVGEHLSKEITRDADRCYNVRNKKCIVIDCKITLICIFPSEVSML